MKLLYTAAVVISFSPMAAFADPKAMTCQFLDVMGQNDRAGIAPMLGELAGAWTQENRVNAVASLSSVLEQFTFAGGAVYELNRLADDYADHVVALRIDGGEIAAARLTYEWGPEGMQLTGLNFERRMAKIVTDANAVIAQPVSCDG